MADNDDVDDATLERMKRKSKEISEEKRKSYASSKKYYSEHKHE